MQQTFTKDFVYERIKDSGFPCWTLGLYNGFKNVVNAAQYWGVDFTDEDSEDTKIEKSIARLAATLSTFPDDSVFVIEIKSGRNANGSTVLGPFQFSNSTPKSDPDPAPAIVQNLGSTIPPGYVPESYLQGVEERLKDTYSRELDAFKREMQEQQREDDYRRRCEALDEREKNLKDLEKSYNSTVAKAVDIVIEVGKRLGGYFLTGAMPTSNAVTSEPLGEPPSDERSMAVNDLADFMYENLSVDAIKELKSNLLKVKENHGLVTQKAPTATATANE